VNPGTNSGVMTERHTRKTDRQITLLDLFRRALESSDPYISHLSLKDRLSKQKRLPIPAKVMALLKPIEPNVSIVTEESESSEMEPNADIILPTEEILIHSDDDDHNDDE
jgi:hypothetical protein